MRRSTLELLLLGMLLAQTLAEDDYIEYEYDEASVSNVTQTKGGQRIVGGQKYDVDTTPFIVGWNLHGGLGTMCTGSLIAPQWVLSAAHCFVGMIKNINKCVRDTKRRGHWMGKNPMNEQMPVKCIEDKDGDQRIIFLNKKRKGVVYLGVDDATNQKDIDRGQAIYIEYILRHRDTYLGGGSYGSNGGYDITLLKLQKSAKSKYVPACLPSPSFKDEDLRGKAQIAGYGRHRRRSCQTDQYGPSKYHYCKLTPKYCKNRYRSRPNSFQKCLRDMRNQCQETAPPQPDRLCSDFFRAQNTPNSIPSGIEDIIIRVGRKNHYCNRRESPAEKSKGWCRVVSNVATGGFRSQTEDDSWGFCSKDCYLNQQEKDGSVARIHEENVDILPDDLCSSFLKSSLKRTPRIMPQILCIGKMERLHYQYWVRKGRNYEQKSPKIVQHRMAMKKGSDLMVRAMGTCNGDSGGPVFVEGGPKDFVVLGAVSGGRGKLGDCGGLNNPTHYARVRFFGNWVKRKLGRDARKLCFAK